ncbi:MAG: hypothetical protein GY851_10510, partial [bacterium]|nr:hypothetical protein [bacterium]
MSKLISTKGWAVRAALLLTAAITIGSAAMEPFEITVGDEVVATVGPDFYGLHYDGPAHVTWDEVHKKEVSRPGMYGSPSARDALHAIGTRVARIFIRCQKAHPEPGVFDWAFLDAAVDQVVDSGMTPMLCLHQGEAVWFVGTKEEPWWTHDEAMVEWRTFARACAERYGD